MLECIILVGLPGTGKSTWINSMGYFQRPDWIVLSTDNFIESVAEVEGKTYSEVFPVAIKHAEKTMQENFEYAIKNKLNIVWDQTNLSRGTRLRKLNKLPLCYHPVVARVFSAPENHDEWLNSASRKGKTIPPHVLGIMKTIYQEPTLSEGFDQIIFN